MLLYALGETGSDWNSFNLYQTLLLIVPMMQIFSSLIINTNSLKVLSGSKVNHHGEGGIKNVKK